MPKVIYFGKAEDGKFYHAILYESTFHIYVREYRVPPWRWVTRKVRVDEVPRSIRERIEREIIPKLKNFLVRLHSFLRDLVVELRESVTDDLDYVINALKIVRRVLTTIDDELREALSDVRDSIVRERVRRVVVNVLSRVRNIFTRELAKLSEEFNVPESVKSPSDLVDDCIVVLEEVKRRVVEKLRV